MTAPGDFGHGVMLPVLRGSTPDPHGDTAYTESHQVGPASIRVTSTANSGTGDARAAWRASVRIPAGQDIRHRDRVRLPDSTVAIVTTRPDTPRNAYTGWAPHTVFTLET
ncbi:MULTISPECIES: hypothetical protein [unclassified Nocardia]|uniref:hypothetical protein n=1 Tax=unclassified Nocardia TaxID=2637762 RepID=UPI00278BC233|nr:MULTISPECIES: hypothetical protein [unclassified Nocardia]